MHLHSACLDWRCVCQNHSRSLRFCNNYTLKLQQNLIAIIIFPFSPPIRTCIYIVTHATFDSYSYVLHFLLRVLWLSLWTPSHTSMIFSSLFTVSRSLFFLFWLLFMQVGRYIRVQITEAWVSTKIGASRCLVSNLQFSVVTRSSFPCLQTLISCLNYWAFSFSSFEISAVKSIRCCRKSYILEKEHFLKGL
jgi:hypothetical protein